jgi:MEDS: MEthanogen/methylotroph, DcmR Sensory domain
METNGNSVDVAGSTLGQRRHICAFFNDIDEHYRVLQSFFKDGFDQGDKAFHIIDPAQGDDHLRRLAEAGIDVEDVVASGQLEVHPWQDAYLRGDRFDQDAMLAFVEELLQSSTAPGSRRVRLMGTVEWSLLDKPGVDDLLEYETRLNYVIPKYTGTVLCAYDLSKLGASTVMYALRTHPLVIIGGLLQENPFYVEPDQLLRELRQEQSHVGAGTAH